jgi:hypothetical protein
MRFLFALRAASFGLTMGVALASNGACAQQAPSFDELASAMSNRLLPESEMPEHLVDCPALNGMSLPRDAFDDFQFQNQWIFNGAYYWVLLRLPAGTCVFLTGDQQRGLTRGEGRALLSAARLDVPDVAHLDAQKATNCYARRDGTFGGDFPAYERGVINGRRYQIFFAPMPPELKLLDDAQHRHAEEQKRALMRLTAKKKNPVVGSAFDVVLSFRKTGKSMQLASLEGTLKRSDGTYSIENWLLDIRRSRLISFADLFVDPLAAQSYIADKYHRNAAKYVSEEMRDLAFIGDENGEQARDYRARMLDAVERVTRVSPPRLLRIEIVSAPVPTRKGPFFGGTFTTELLPNGSPVFWTATQDELKPFLKQEYVSAISGTSCPALPSQ